MSELDEFFPRDEAPSISDPVVPKKKKVSNKAYGQRGEKWTKDYMEKLVGIKLEKRSDAPYDFPGGTVYPATNQLDHHGWAKVPGVSMAVAVEVEVKTFEDDWTISTLSDKQVEKLTEATDNGCLAMLCLVERKGIEIVNMYWIPWPQKENNVTFSLSNMWHTYHRASDEHSRCYRHTILSLNFAWVMHHLRQRVSGSFKGKSIRRKDRDLLNEFLVTKVGNRWNLGPKHWMRKLFDID